MHIHIHWQSRLLFKQPISPCSPHLMATDYGQRPSDKLLRPRISFLRYGSTLTVQGRYRRRSATVSGGLLLARKISSLRTLRSISTRGSTSRDDGILGLTLKPRHKNKTKQWQKYLRCTAGIRDKQTYAIRLVTKEKYMNYGFRFPFSSSLLLTELGVISSGHLPVTTHIGTAWQDHHHN